MNACVSVIFAFIFMRSCVCVLVSLSMCVRACGPDDTRSSTVFLCRSENATLRTELDAVKLQTKKRTDTDAMRDELYGMLERLEKLEVKHEEMIIQVQNKAEKSDLSGLRDSVESIKMVRLLPFALAVQSFCADECRRGRCFAKAFIGT